MKVGHGIGCEQGVSWLEGVATIEWKTDATRRLLEEIKEKQANAESSGLTWIRENDVLTQCLGPEQPGRVRGVSSYNGWKEAWPEHSDMYRKRRKISSADLLAMKETMKEERKAELTKDILSILAAQGLQIVALSRNTSPAPGWRSSCASASEAAKQHNGGPSDQEDGDGNGNEHEDEIPERMDTDHDTISGLSDPTPCALMHTVGGHRSEVACGMVYPRQLELHTVPINVECAVVKVEFVAE